MAYDWTQIGINEITNLYLYGQLTKPDDLMNDSLIRHADYTYPISMDMISFMATGPGRFAVGPQSSLVTDFMYGVPFAGRVVGTRQVFHKVDLIKLYNDSGRPMTGTSTNISLQQYNYNDSANDFAFRTYVYNSSLFKISDNADFVIEADGTRHIENYAIYAFDDNFDFKSDDGLAGIGNPALETAIDPSIIGRKVNINFVNKDMVPITDYYLIDFVSDVLKLASTVSPGGIVGVPSQMQEIVDNLWGTGITKFVDSDGRPIFYGTMNSENLAASNLINGLSSSFLIQSPFRTYVRSHSSNGVRIIGGDGNDTIIGGDNNDVLVGGKGSDTLKGGSGSDTYIYNTGDGKDTIDDSDASGVVKYDGTGLGTGYTGDGNEVKKAKKGGSFKSEDGKYNYSWGGDGQNLSINGEVTIKNFHNGDLGITLYEKKKKIDPPPPPSPPGGISGGYTGGQTTVFVWRDPLTLDLNGNGLETVPLTPPPILFDHTGSGIKQGTGWIAPGDGFLVLDRNGNGQIDNGTELFGDSTPLLDAAGNVIGKAKDGFAAMAQEDTNHDGIVDAQDTNWTNLRVWQDLNQDGISQTDELTTLDQQGIASINVGNESHSLTLPNGNQIADLGTFTYTDGHVARAGVVNNMADVNLALDTFHRTFTDPIPLTAKAETLPDLQGSGKVRDLREAASLQTAAGAALADALTHYSQAATRAEQLAQLDNIISLWGATTDIGTMQSRAIEHGYRFSTSITAEMQQHLTALEAFNGRNYFKMPWEDRTSGPGAQQGLFIGWNGDPKNIFVNLQWIHINLLNQSYAALSDYVYQALLPQTRLKPYFDNLYTLTQNGISTYDFDEVDTVFRQQFALNPEKAIGDLLEFNQCGKAMFAQSDWHTPGWAILGEMLNNATMTPAIQKVLADFNVGFDGHVPVTSVWKDQILVAQDTGSTLNGGSYNDILIGGAGSDILNASFGADTLIGGAGDDELDGSWGNDTLQGGSGSDTLLGGEGSDTYLYSRGDGADTIVDAANVWWYPDTNTVQFGAGISLVDIAVTYDSVAQSVVLDLGNGDNIHIGNPENTLYSYPAGYQPNLAIQQIKFADGSVISTNALIEQYGMVQNGTGGADMLEGSDSVIFADVLNGAAGDDTLIAGAGNDILDGGTGADTLVGGEGDDTYVYNLGDGIDTIVDGRLPVYNNWSGQIQYANSNVLRFGAGISAAMLTPVFDSVTQTAVLELPDGGRIDVGTLSDLSIQTLQFADGSSVSIATFFAQEKLEQVGTEGADTLNGTALNDRLLGLGGDDALNGVAGNDVLEGGAGNDTLQGGAGSDAIVGGSGDDTLTGGTGSDTYVYNLGDGSDTIVDSSSVQYSWQAIDRNTLSFGANITADMITPRFDYPTQTVMLDLGNGDSVEVGTVNSLSIQTLQFADGTEQTLDQFLTDQGLVINGTAGADVLIGSDSKYSNYIFAGAGDDELVGGYGNDVLSGDAGKDILDGGAGNDTYVFNLGDGADTINDRSGNNTLAFGAGITLDLIQPRLDGVTGEISLYLGNGDSIAVGKYVASQSYLSLSIGQIVFADGGTVQLSQLLSQKGLQVEGSGLDDILQGAMSNINQMYGFDGNDTLTGGQRDDILEGGSGNDNLHSGYGDDLLTGGLGDDGMSGGEGNDVYVYNFGDGIDGIIDSSRNGQVNTLRLGAGANVIGLEYRGGTTGDLWLSFADGGSLRIANVAADNVVNTCSVQRFELADGTVLSAQQLLSQFTIQVIGTDNYWQATTGDLLIGTNLNDEVLGFDGNDTLLAGNGNDNLYGDFGNDVLSGDGGDDYLSGGDGNDMLFGREGDDGLDGGYGNDVLSGDAGNDYLYGAEGNDTLFGDAGDDELVGAWGNDVLQGDAGNDILEGAAGNDMLAGGIGDDTYLFNLGDGEDRINDTAGTDVLSFGPGITYGDLTFTKNGVNLRIALANGSDAIVIENWFTGTSTLNTLRFSDISTFDLTSIAQSVADQPMIGTSGDDIVLGSIYNDTLQGGLGNDTLIGGTGDDVYRFNLNDGTDEIYELSSMTTVTGGDTLEFGVGITPDMLNLSLQVERLNGGRWDTWNLTAFPDQNADLMVGDRQRQVLNIAIDNMGDNIRVMSGKGAIEKFRFADGTEYTWQQMFEMQGGGGVQDISALTYTNTYWNGSAYVPYTYVDAPQSMLDGTGLAATFNGGVGNDLMLGGMQNDAYVFNLGDGQDVIADFGGQDEIVFGPGITAADLTWNYDPASATPFMLNVGSGGDSIAILNGEKGAIESFSFSDGSAITFADLVGNQGGIVLQPASATGGYFYAAGSNNLIVGTDGADNIYDGGDSSFIAGGKGDDVINLDNSSDVVLFGEGDGQDTVNINQWSSTSTLLFGPDVDPASLKFKLYQSLGSPSWYGNGFDIVQDMLIEYGSLGDSVTVFGAVPDSGGEGYGETSSRIRIQFADGTVWSYADMLARAANMIVADPINPVLLGTAGSDTYVVDDLGSEFTIVDGAGDGNFNTVELGWDYASGLNLPPVADRVTLEDEPFNMAVSATKIPPYVLTRVGGSLSVQFDNGTTLNIDGFDPTDPLGSSAIREFKFTDGTVLSIAQILEAGIETTGTDGNDVLTGTAVNDLITGLSGNDTISGGKGNDVLRGGTGNDTYVFTSGDGADTIEDASFYWGQQQLVLDNNVLQLGAGIDPASVAVKFDAASGKVYLDMGNGDSVVIGEPGNFSVQRVEFDDIAGTVWDEWMMTDLMTVGALASPVPAQSSGITYSAVMANGAALPSWLSFDGATGKFSGTPTNDDIATLAVSVTASDAGGNSTTSNFALDVLNVNDAPTVSVELTNQITMEDAAFSFTLPAGTFDDVDFIHGDTLSYFAIMDDGSALPSWLKFDTYTQTFSGTPDNSAVGTYSVTVTATDTGGLSASSTFMVDVANVNDAPVVSMALAAQATLEDAAFSFTVPAGSFNDVDFMHGDLLTYNATLGDGTALPAWLTFDAATQTFSGTPLNDDVGNLSVLVTATDTGGLSASTAFSVVITNVNDAPVVSMAIAPQSAYEDTAFSFTVPAATFADVDFIHGDTLAYSATLADGTALPGWLTFDAVTQTFSGTALNEDVANLNVLVTATDSGGLSASSAFTLDVINVNDTPTAHDDAGAAVEDGGAVQLDASTLLANDTDPDSIHGDVLSIVGVSQAASGAAVSLVNGNVQYDIGNLYQSLAQGQTTTDTFSYTISDTAGATSTATVSMTLTGVNDAAVTADDTASVLEDGTITATGNVLSNDNDVDQGTVLSVANAGTLQGTYGQLILNADGAYSYQLDNASLAVQSLAAGQVATETFAYQASDGLASTPAILTVTITGSNDAPVTALPLLNQTATETGTFAYQLPANAFTDIDQGDTLTYTATMADGTALPAWLAFDAATLTFSSALAIGAAGLWDIRVTATDPSGASASSNFTLDIAKLIKGSCEEDDLQGTALRDIIYGLNEEDILRGHAGDDILVGGTGNDILEGGAGNDILIGGVPAETTLAGAPVPVECAACEDDDDDSDSDSDGEHEDEREDEHDNNLLNGGAGNDTLKGGARDDLLIGGTGDDTIDTGTGRDIIAFNKGDGRDVVLAPAAGQGQTEEPGNTLSLGGGIQTGDLAFRHLGNDLVLETGATEQITFKDWYASPANHSIVNLQLIDTLDIGAHKARNTRLDFAALVAYFDQAVAADRTTNHWALTHALLDWHLEQSKGTAIGGDIAYQYGQSGSLTAVSIGAAQDVLESSVLGGKAQKLHDLSGEKGGSCLGGAGMLG